LGVFHEALGVVDALLALQSAEIRSVRRVELLVKRKL